MACITMITSAKDGSGKSAVSALLGLSLAESGKKVLVVELDNGPGSLDVYTSCSGSGVYDMGDIFSGECTPEQAIASSDRNDNLKVIFKDGDRTDYQLEKLIDPILTICSDFDHVIFDTGSETALIDSVSKVAMHSIVVSSPDPISIRDTKNLCDRLYSANTPDVRFLINRIHTGFFTSRVTKTVDGCIDTVGVRLIGVIPDSDEIRTALFLSKKFKKKSAVKAAFSNIAARIDGEDRPLAVTQL